MGVFIDQVGYLNPVALNVTLIATLTLTLALRTVGGNKSTTVNQQISTVKTFYCKLGLGGTYDEEFTNEGKFVSCKGNPFASRAVCLPPNRNRNHNRNRNPTPHLTLLLPRPLALLLLLPLLSTATPIPTPTPCFERRYATLSVINIDSAY